MADTGLILALLAVTGLATTVTALMLCMCMRRLHRLSDRLERMLPECEDTLREGRQLLHRVNRASRHVEGFVARACETATEGLDHVAEWGGKLQHFWQDRSGNGTGSGRSRRQARGL